MTDVAKNIDEEVKITPDEPVVVKLGDVGDIPAVEKTPEVKQKVEEPDEREKALQELRQQLDDQKAAAARERQEREQIEQFAREQARKAQFAEVDAEDSRLSTIKNAIDSVEQSAQGAERAYADAMAVGDYATAAKAQRAMAQAESQILQLNNGKRALEERLQARSTTEGRVREPELPFQRSQDPVEAMAARLTPKSAEWLRAHPEAANQVSKLTAAHSAATELEGIRVETPEYFAYIEQRLGIGEKTTADPAPKPKPKKELPSMPTSSGTGNGAGGGANSMTLSPAEVEMAIMSEPDLPRDKALELYAKNKMALMKEGRIR